jgi:hypothetical protein
VDIFRSTASMSTLNQRLTLHSLQHPGIETAKTTPELSFYDRHCNALQNNA